jgi:hypothetical protein
MHESVLTLLGSTKCKASKNDLAAKIGPWTEEQRQWVRSLPTIKIRFRSPDHCAEIGHATEVPQYFVGSTSDGRWYLCDTRGYDYPREMLQLDWSAVFATERPAASSGPRNYGGAGSISNARITARNGGVRHQFINDIGGCSANYR